ncbi:MAG: GAF domain-containing protein [Bacteroidetes bacterium]|nr:GAF domain-containing protein [Bacteroidota bacterium]MCW5896592.1 GAF domain-containing protein [Bacteroidota bacterium]
MQPKKRKPAKRTSAPKKNDRHVLIELVQSNTLFSNVSKRTLERIISKLVTQHHKNGETIFDESTKGRDLYLILTGKVHIKKYTKYGTESLLAVLHERDFFGELSLIGGFPRSARAEAVGDCTIICLGYDHYQALLKESRTFAQNLLQHLALRLRTIDQMFVSELERNVASYQAQLDKLQLLIEASKTLNSTLDSDELLDVILTAATTSLRADRGTLYLIDPVTHELWSKVVKGEGVVEIRLSMGKGLAGYVAKTGQTVNIVDAYKDPRFNPEIDKKSGYRTHNVLCMPLRNKDGTIVGVFQLLNKRGGPFTKEDVDFIDALSVHASIAIQNAQMIRDLVQSERLSAIGRMASTIIHDIKNPMATMRIYAQVIKSKTQDSEAAEIADLMMKQVDRFVTMTQEVLDFSRGVSELHVEPVELKDVLPAILTFVDHDLAKRGITFVKNFDYTGTVLMDAEKIMRVFQNIAGNAADAMPEGGTLTLTIKPKGDRLSFEFSDTGQGMPEEIRARVFEPFFTRGKKHGTGLGMAIVKKIVDDHKGSIELDSETGRGTTVRILLPLECP